MRRMWMGIPCLGLALLALTGCWTTDSHKIKPPPHEEEFRLPPDDKRYSMAPQFPKETLNQAPKKGDLDDPQSLPARGQSKMGMMGGAGGTGGGH